MRASGHLLARMHRSNGIFIGVSAAWIGATIVACASHKTSLFSDFDGSPVADASSALEESCAITMAVVGAFVPVSSAEACKVSATLAPAPLGDFQQLTASPECVTLCGDAGSSGLCALSSEYAKDFAAANAATPEGGTPICPDESDAGTIEVTCYVVRTQQIEGPCVLGGP
jgi:hypothetical protein